jgi:type IV fimbrial biogenesis protein FimT
MRIHKLSLQARQATPKPQAAHTHRGFSLIELLIVVVILGVVAAIAAPNFQGTIENNRVNSAAEGMRDAIAVARTEAIRRGTSVWLEPDCTPASWSCGWKLMQNGASGTPEQIRTGDTPSAVDIALDGTATRITFNPNGTFAPNNTFFVFRPQGQTTGGRALMLNRGLMICRSGSAQCPI